jgi:hypothetical protein
MPIFTQSHAWSVISVSIAGVRRKRAMNPAEVVNTRSTDAAPRLGYRCKRCHVTPMQQTLLVRLFSGRGVFRTGPIIRRCGSKINDPNFFCVPFFPTGLSKPPLDAP